MHSRFQFHGGGNGPGGGGRSFHGRLVCYDNYEFSVGPLGGGTWPTTCIGGARGGGGGTRRVPPRENGRAHTRHTHTTRTCVHRGRERKRERSKGPPGFIRARSRLPGGSSEKHRLNSIRIRPLPNSRYRSGVRRIDNAALG